MIAAHPNALLHLLNKQFKVPCCMAHASLHCRLFSNGMIDCRQLWLFSHPKLGAAATAPTFRQHACVFLSLYQNNYNVFPSVCDTPGYYAPPLSPR